MTEIDVKIESQLNKANELFSRGKIDECIIVLESAYLLIPEGYTTSTQLYYLALYLCVLYQQKADFNQVGKWATILKKSHVGRADIGEGEYYAGISKFEEGKFEEAFGEFLITFEKSNREFFLERKDKYYDFFRDYYNARYRGT